MQIKEIRKQGHKASSMLPEKPSKEPKPHAFFMPIMAEIPLIDSAIQKNRRRTETVVVFRCSRVVFKVFPSLQNVSLIIVVRVSEIL